MSGSQFCTAYLAGALITRLIDEAAGTVPEPVEFRVNGSSANNLKVLGGAVVVVDDPKQRKWVFPDNSYFVAEGDDTSIYNIIYICDYDGLTIEQ